MGVTRCHLKGIFSAAAAQRQIVLHGDVCARQQPVCQEARRRERAPPHCSRRDATRPLGAAQVVTDVNPSVLSRMFLPTQIFHCHLAPHRCGAQVQYQVNGLTYVLLSSPRTLVKDGKYVSMVHSPFLTTLCASVQKIKGATMRCGCTWTLLTIRVCSCVTRKTRAAGPPQGKVLSVHA